MSAYGRCPLAEDGLYYQYYLSTKDTSLQLDDLVCFQQFISIWKLPPVFNQSMFKSITPPSSSALRNCYAYFMATIWPSKIEYMTKCIIAQDTGSFKGQASYSPVYVHSYSNRQQPSHTPTCIVFRRRSTIAVTFVGASVAVPPPMLIIMIANTKICLTQH